MDKRLKGVSECLGVDEAESERATQDAKDEQGQDCRQLETLGDDLARDTECDGGNEGRQDGVHSTSTVADSICGPSTRRPELLSSPRRLAAECMSCIIIATTDAVRSVPPDAARRRTGPVPLPPGIVH